MVTGMIMSVSLVLGVATTTGFLASAPQRPCHRPPARTRTLEPQLSAPAELAEAPWLVKVAQACPFTERVSCPVVTMRSRTAALR